MTSAFHVVYNKRWCFHLFAAVYGLLPASILDIINSLQLIALVQGSNKLKTMRPESPRIIKTDTVPIRTGLLSKFKFAVFGKIGKVQDAKSKTIIRNVFFSFFVKAINILANFVSIPLVLTFLNNTQYGIWLTLTSILGWFSLFDLGFGNGMRNHLTIALTQRDFKEGKIYVSTTYTVLSVIFGSLIVVFLCIYPFINWNSVFNAPSYMNEDINAAVLFAMCFLFVQFVVRLITTVFLSFQRAALADLANALVQVFILLGFYCLKFLQISSLRSVAIVYSITPVIIYAGLSIYFFSSKYSEIKPSFSFYRKSYVNKLLKLGMNFFVIQVAALVLYASDNFIIAHLFSPADVTVYNISFKYFTVASVLFTIILSPFWSMVTQSYAQGDMGWIRRSIKNLLILWSILSVIGVIQLYLSAPFYKMWTHGKVEVPLKLSLIMLVYTVCTTYGSIFSSFLNGIGKIRMQLYIAVTSMILNIPFAIFLVKFFKMGIIAIPLATIACMIIGNVIISVQYGKIVNMRANGAWGK